jgi:hypothetical protein
MKLLSTLQKAEMDKRIVLQDRAQLALKLCLLEFQIRLVRSKWPIEETSLTYVKG